MPYKTRKETTTEDIDCVKALMLGQDNRATSFPIFEVRERSMLTGLDLRFNDDATPVIVMNDGEGDAVIPVDKLTTAEAEKIILDLEETSGVSREFFEFRDFNGEPFGDLRVNAESLLETLCRGAELDIYDISNSVALMSFVKTGMLQQSQIVTFCFTQEGANRYIEENQHRMNDPYIYVSSAYRNTELQQVMQHLLGEVVAPSSALKP